MVSRLNEAPEGGVTYEHANPNYTARPLAELEVLIFAHKNEQSWVARMSQRQLSEQKCSECGRGLAFGPYPVEQEHEKKQMAAGRHLVYRGRTEGCALVQLPLPIE